MKTLSLIVFLVLVSTSNVLAQPQPQSPCCNLGDANGDGMVKASDLTTIRKHILGLTTLPWEEQCQSDVDGDGILTDNDLVLIQEYLLGFRDTFPRCGDLDGDGTLEWDSQFGPADDLNFWTSCAFQNQDCPNADADNDGDYDLDDIGLFLDLTEGQIQSFPGCACGEGACG